MKSILEKELVEKVCPKYLGEFQQIIQKKGSYFGGTVSILFTITNRAILPIIRLYFNIIFKVSYAVNNMLLSKIKVC